MFGMELVVAYFMGIFRSQPMDWGKRVNASFGIAVTLAGIRNMYLLDASFPTVAPVALLRNMSWAVTSLVCEQTAFTADSKWHHCDGKKEMCVQSLKLSLFFFFWLEHHAMMALDGGEWSASRSSRFSPKEIAPGTHWIGGWVGLRASLDAVVKRNIPSSCRDSNPVAQNYITELSWSRGEFSKLILIHKKKHPEPFYRICPFIHDTKCDVGLSGAIR
jgi:hypothetical protein